MPTDLQNTTHSAKGAGLGQQTQDDKTLCPAPPSTMRVLNMLGKGGSGKTTSALNLAVCAWNCGWKVAILDVDPQKCATTWRRLRHNSEIRVLPTSPSVIAERIQQARRNGIDLLIVDNGKDRHSQSAQIAQLADYSLVFTRPSSLDLGVCMDWAKWLQNGSAQFGIVLASAPSARRLAGRQAPIDSPLVREAREFLRDIGRPVWGGQIPSLHALVYAAGFGMAVRELAPESSGAVAYNGLWLSVCRAMERGATLQ